MNTDIVWDSPTDRRTNWSEKLTPLIEQPGRWARFKYDRLGQARMNATMINHRRLAIPDGEWEARSESIKDEEGGYLYVRYVGPTSK